MSSSAGARLVLDGAVVLDGLINRTYAHALGAEVDAALADILGGDPSQGRRYNLSRVAAPYRRFDMKLSLSSPAIWNALNVVIDTLQRQHVIELLGRAPLLYELGALTSDPGAQSQPFHYDHLADGRLNVISCFIALQVPSITWCLAVGWEDAGPDGVHSTGL